MNQRPSVEQLARTEPILKLPPIKRKRVKWQRNWPCFCGSGKKHKKCCLSEMLEADKIDGNECRGE